MTKTFLGRWLVTEYIFNPDGTFAGINHQQRRLTRLANGDIEVWQKCFPEPALANHPMGAFAGEWVFTLRVNGRNRHYQGPDVVGMGIQWQDGVMTGTGVWPNFGYNFTSFGVLVEPHKQLTGGRFLQAGTLVANIVGVAVDETVSAEYPTLNITPPHPQTIASIWHNAIDPTHTRTYTASGFTDGPTYTIDERADHQRITIDQTTHAIGKTYGPLWEIVGSDAVTGAVWRQFELLDADARTLISVKMVGDDVTYTQFKAGEI